MTTQTIERPQARSALKKGNQIRFANSVFLRDLRELPQADGLELVADALMRRDLADQTYGSLTVARLLLAIRKYGWAGMTRAARAANLISADRRVRDLSDRGWEFDLVANPTRSWRVSLNAALPRAYQENVSQDFSRYMQANDAVLRQVVSDAGVTIDST